MTSIQITVHFGSKVQKLPPIMKSTTKLKHRLANKTHPKVIVKVAVDKTDTSKKRLKVAVKRVLLPSIVALQSCKMLI